jgi:hypothetical protein
MSNGSDGKDRRPGVTVADHDVVISISMTEAGFGGGVSASQAHELAELLDAGCEASKDRVSDRVAEVASNIARTLRRAGPDDAN